VFAETNPHLVNAVPGRPSCVGAIRMEGAPLLNTAPKFEESVPRWWRAALVVGHPQDQESRTRTEGE
jgi:hypothetical protein